ncbi:MAG: PIN domain-containing protein [Planctomycetota bacterium]
MIYLDTSVALAWLLGEDRCPPDELWRDTLVSSRLLEYELWTRINAEKLWESHGEHVRELVGRVALVKLDPRVLARASEPFPQPVRTLDALHLASLEYLLTHGQSVALASYDERMLGVARALDWPIHDCG